VKRRKSPKRTGGLKRSRIRPVNPERRERRRESQFGDHAERVRSLPCLVPGCREVPVHAAHVRSRAAGGSAADLVPLCWRHHREQHDRGVRTFERIYGVDLAAIAAELADDAGRDR
jgi:hypothetical protein